MPATTRGWKGKGGLFPPRLRGALLTPDSDLSASGTGRDSMSVVWSTPHPGAECGAVLWTPQDKATVCVSLHPLALALLTL